MRDDAEPENKAVFSAAPLQGIALWLAAGLAGVANLVVALDMTIANVSIPSIAAGLGASPREGAWVVTSYVVAEAITVPLTGWLAKRFGSVRTFAFALAGFGIASALCGLATSLGALVAFRVLQGLAGGPMVPLSQTILLSIFPKEKAGMAMALWGMTAVAGPCIGPVMGGYICDNWSWPWIFLINTPIAVIGAFFAWQVLAHRDPPRMRLSIDYIGLALMVVWIGALQVALDRGHDLDWLSSRFITTLLIVAVIGFAAFLIWELTEKNPVVNLRIFRHRGYTTVVWLVSLNMGAFFAQSLVLVLWLQTNLGYTAGATGQVMAPGAIAMLFMSLLVGWLSNKVDLRSLVSFGLFTFALLFLWQAGFTPDVTFNMVLVAQICTGLCVAFIFAPAMSLCLSFVKADEVQSAAGLLHFIRTLCMAFMTSATTTAWQNGAARHRAAITDRYDETGALDQMGAVGLPHDQALNYVDGMIQSQSVLLSTVDAFFVFGIGMAISALAIWMVPRAVQHVSAPVH